MDATRDSKPARRRTVKRWLSAFDQLALDLSPLAPDERWFHTDLQALPLDELRAERTRLALSIALSGRASAWTTRRLHWLQAELEARTSPALLRATVASGSPA